MYKAEFEAKMEELLQGKSTYKTIRTNPTEKLMKQKNIIVNYLHKKQLIDNNLKININFSAANAPRIYGLPEINKDNTKLKPIVSSV